MKKDISNDYRSFTKEVFKKLFRYAESEVPSDAILEELVTNCNRAGYEAAPFIQTHLAFGQSLVIESPKKVMNIDCTNKNNVRIRCDMRLPILAVSSQFMHNGKICDLSNSLEFTIESQNGEDLVTYVNGELSLTIPEALKNHKDGGKSLFDLKEYFETLCLKLGLKFETKVDGRLNKSRPQSEESIDGLPSLTTAE